MEPENPKETIQVSKKEWRCFHCDEVFTDFAEAELHFGRSEYHTPVCQIDATQLRDLERQLHSYHEEDTDLHRALHKQEAEHAVALRREEEKGYARGLQASYLQADT